MKMALRIALLFLVLASPATVYGVDHVVGGSSGWSLAGNYDSWAAGETFTVGDKLSMSFLWFLFHIFIVYCMN